MKRYFAMFLSAVCLFLSERCQAQGTLYYSNLGQPSSGSGMVAGDSWLAEPFTTGPNNGGYTLNSIQLLVNGTSGSPNGISVSICEWHAPANYVGNQIASLTGADPTTAGLYTFTTPGVTLSPSSTYFVVVNAATPAAQGAYSLSFAADSTYNSIDNWQGGMIRFSSTDGTSWQVNRNTPFQFGITATAVPEPGTCALVGLGLAALGARWKKRHAARPEQL